MTISSHDGGVERVVNGPAVIWEWKNASVTTSDSAINPHISLYTLPSVELGALCRIEIHRAPRDLNPDDPDFVKLVIPPEASQVLDHPDCKLQFSILVPLEIEE